MSGFLITVTYTDSKTSTQFTVVHGIADGVAPNATGAITDAENAVISVKTILGQTPINVSAVVSQTR